MPNLLDYINRSDFSCCDGIAIALGARIKGIRIPILHGPDLMLEACRYGVEKGWRHYFYGGKDGVPELLSRKLARKFPGLAIAGTYSPPFRSVGGIEDASVVQQINDAKPDIIWVGLGLLKQSRWIEDHRNVLEAPMMIGVGAAFDFLAGTIRRAPEIFQKLGLEWFYRLCFEPRMLVRNWVSLVIALELVFQRGSLEAPRQR